MSGSKLKAFLLTERAPGWQERTYRVLATTSDEAEGMVAEGKGVEHGNPEFLQADGPIVVHEFWEEDEYGVKWMIECKEDKA